MTSKLDNFYLDKKEPIRACLLALRDLIADFDPQISKEWKFNFPFFYYKGKMLCYLRIDKQTQLPYIGFVDGYLIKDDELIQGDRAKMKILLIDPNADLPIKKIKSILSQAIHVQNK